MCNGKATECEWDSCLCRWYHHDARDILFCLQGLKFNAQTCWAWSTLNLLYMEQVRFRDIVINQMFKALKSEGCHRESKSEMLYYLKKDILFQRNQTFGLNLNPDKSSVWCLQVIGPGEVNPLHRGIKCVQDKGGQKNSLLAAHHQYLHLPLNPRWSLQLSRMEPSQAASWHGGSGYQSSFWSQWGSLCLLIFHLLQMGDELTW